METRKREETERISARTSEKGESGNESEIERSNKTEEDHTIVRQRAAEIVQMQKPLYFETLSD